MARADAEAEIGVAFEDFDRIVVAYSGGKDSLATVLHLLELGVPREQIELWHHEIDEPGEPFMDWPCTPAYCRATAAALGVPVYFSGRVGGFLGELLRQDRIASPVRIETPSGTLLAQPQKWRNPLTRMRFPAVGAIESGRWCSAILKIDVGRRVFSTDPRFRRGLFLYVSGERAEEGGKRKHYKAAEWEKSRQGRRIRRWRPVHRWPEAEVWAIIQRWGIRPHVGYQLGFGRLSCAPCIFSNRDQWAALRQVLPAMFGRVAEAEAMTGHTIHRSRLNVVELADEGDSFLPPAGKERDRLFEVARGAGEYGEPVVVSPGDWEVPLGAFKKTGGPT